MEDNFGSRLKRFAKHRYGTIGALAEAAGMRQSQLSKYITGISTPTLEVLERLGAAGVSIDWLITGKGNAVVESAAKSNTDSPPLNNDEFIVMDHRGLRGKKVVDFMDVMDVLNAIAERVEELSELVDAGRTLSR